MARAAAQAGVRIYEHSRAQPAPKGQSGEVKTAEGHVKSQHVVLGCNAYLGKLIPQLAGNIIPINNFLIATEPLPSHLLPRINRDNLSMSDTLFVINYWKLSEDGRMLFGGGENYSSRFPRDIKAFVRPRHMDDATLKARGGAVAVSCNASGEGPVPDARAREWSGPRVTLAPRAMSLPPGPRSQLKTSLVLP